MVTKPKIQPRSRPNPVGKITKTVLRPQTMSAEYYFGTNWKVTVQKVKMADGGSTAIAVDTGYYYTVYLSPRSLDFIGANDVHTGEVYEYSKNDLDDFYYYNSNVYNRSLKAARTYLKDYPELQKYAKTAPKRAPGVSVVQIIKVPGKPAKYETIEPRTNHRRY